MGERTEGMIKQAQELIEQAYQRGYNAGYEEGKGQTWSEEVKKYEIEPEKSLKYIEQGRNEAWKAVKKIYLSIDDGGLPSDEVKKIFGMEYCYDIMTKFSASEAIAKIKAYEEQKKQEEDEKKFKIGDEVISHTTHKIGIVVGYNTINNKDWLCLFMEEYQVTQNVTAERFEKTGRHFDVMGILKKMQDGE